MAFRNYMAREVDLRIVYTGPPGAGKTSCLVHVERDYPQLRGKIQYEVTPDPDEVWMDFVPATLPKVQGFAVRVHLYTRRGAAADRTKRLAMLQRADALIFVADSAASRQEENQRARAELQEHLEACEVPPPVVFLFNKRDVASLSSVQALRTELAVGSSPCFEAVATEGTGVYPALTAAVKAALLRFQNAP